MPAIVALSVAIGGCATRPADQQIATRTTDAASPVLRIDGESVVLGDATGTPMPLQVYVAHIQQQLVAGHDEDVGELVRNYPDLAEQAVLSSDFHLPTQRVIAAWLDVLASPAQGGWSSFVADRIDHPQRYVAWQRDRADTWFALRKGAFTDVADQAVDLPVDAPTPWPALDAALLRATATLAAGRPADAAALFEQTAQHAAAWDARVATRANLFASLGYQLAGNVDAASRARDAALRVVSLPDIREPMILRLLLETHPAGGASNDAPPRRGIHARLARVELERGSPQTALLAWRAAEADPGTEPTRDRLRLGQAESLIALGQSEPAIAMLIGLAGTDVRPEALVMLGLVHMRRGQVEVGLAMLNEAVAGTSAESHPHIYADSGFALLSTGKSTAGQALVREARAVYQARHDKQALRRLLSNELRYAQAVGDPGLTQQARRALLEADQ